MVWGGISLKGCTDLHVPLLLLENEMKSSKPLSDLALVQWLWVPPGAGQRQTHVSRVNRQFLDDKGIDGID